MFTKDQDLIKVWVKEYSDKLYTWALTKTSSKEVAEDLVQETFIVAYTSLGKFEGKSSPQTWLFSILNYKIIDFYRKRKTQPISLNQLSEMQADAITNGLFTEKGGWLNWENNSIWESEEHLLDDSDFNAKLKNCIEGLPPNWSLAISAKYILNKSAEDICQELGIAKTNYWQIIHRAKLLLKICIEKHWL